jgi:hypothetical protein
MRDEWTSRRIGRSSLIGFILTVVAFGLALALVGCSQADRDSPLVPSQHHIQLPSLAPVVQAVIPAVVHVSAIQRPNETSVGEGTRPACGARNIRALTVVCRPRRLMS